MKKPVSNVIVFPEVCNTPQLTIRGALTKTKSNSQKKYTYEYYYLHLANLLFNEFNTFIFMTLRNYS
jgi:hypothetical protein